MSSPEVRKRKSESFEYSWFLPAGGNGGSVIVSQVPTLELEADPANIQDSETAAMEARTEKWRHSGEKKQRSRALISWNIDSNRLGLAGIAGWSAMAAVGGLLLSTRAGPFPGVQLGILGGVWVGISALIWFLPKKL
jgi:hypothetical protein